jgi:hypothetical protein
MPQPGWSQVHPGTDEHVLSSPSVEHAGASMQSQVAQPFMSGFDPLGHARRQASAGHTGAQLGVAHTHLPAASRPHVGQ